MAHRMLESLSRWPMTALQAASTAPELTNMPRSWKLGAAHAVGVDVEVSELPVAFAGQGAGEFQGAPGGEQGGDVAGVEFGEAFGKPVMVAAAEQQGCEGRQVVDVLAGVVEIDDLGGSVEQFIGDVLDPYRAVAADDELADVLSAAAAGLRRR
jgi:hypothetical protein